MLFPRQVLLFGLSVWLCSASTELRLEGGQLLPPPLTLDPQQTAQLAQEVESISNKAMSAASLASCAVSIAAGASRKDKVCWNWRCKRAGVPTGFSSVVNNIWLNGDVSTCTPGTLAASAISTTVKLINLYRFIAGLPAVTGKPWRTRGVLSVAVWHIRSGLWW